MISTFYLSGQRALLILLSIVFGFIGVGALNAQTVATPDFAPNAGDGQTPFYVTITCGTAGADVRYTVNGVDPTEASLLIPGDGKVRIASNLTLKARAFKAGMTQSAVKSASYRVTGAITGGGAHVLALTTSGNLYGWGVQSFGRLGNGSTSSTEALNPTTVLKTGGSALTDVIDMSGGYLFSLAATADGKVWAAGENSDGQLGSNSNTDASVMQRVLKNAVTYSSAVESDFLGGIVGVSAGADFSTAVASDGKVWSWGQRTRGRLGDGYTSTTASQRRYASTVKTIESGNPDLADVVQVRSGRGFSVALSDLDAQGRGSLWAWGRNVEGQLGQGNTTDSGYARQVKRDAVAGNWMDKVVDFAVGYDHAVAIRQDDAGVRTVWCWGEQQNGRLGNGVGTAAAKSYPVQVEVSAGVPLTNIVQVAAAGRFTLALDASGEVWAWGYNADGQLGDGTTTNRSYAQKVKKSAGATDFLTDVVYIGAGGHDVASPYPGFALAITSTGSFYGWGQNDRGQTGGGTNTPGNRTYATLTTFTTNLSNAAPSVSLSVNPSTAVEPATFNLEATASDTDGSVVKVSFYENGVFLGDDTASPYSWSVSNRAYGNYTYTAVAHDSLGAFTEHSQSVTATLPPVQAPTVYPEGGSAVLVRQVFLQSTPGATIYYTTDGSTPTTSSPSIAANSLLRIPRNITLKYFAAKAGMVSSPVYSAAYQGKMQVSVNYDHSLLVDSSGKVWSWGDNSLGQLGVGNKNDRAVPVRVPNLTDIIEVSAGGLHSLALKSDGTVWAWGDNSTGDLGDGTTTERLTPIQVPNLSSVVAIATQGAASMALKSDGTVWTWGYNNNGQLGVGSLIPGQTSIPTQTALTEIIAISGGAYHGLALKSNGSVWSWGMGLSGITGRGENAPIDNPIPGEISGLTDVVAIEAGGYSSAVLLRDGSIRTWGANLNWQTRGEAGSNVFSPISIAAGTTFVGLAGGNYHTSAIRSDGAVINWGANSDGQCAVSGGGNVSFTLASGLPGIHQSAAGDHTAALTSSGALWTWGKGADGRLGDGTETNRSTPALVSFSFVDADNDGIADDWQNQYFPGGYPGANSDSEPGGSDGLTNLDEYLRGTNPLLRDTDGDGMTDGDEVTLGMDPLVAATEDTAQAYVQLTLYTPLE